MRLLSGPMVPSPAWASKWHRLSFNKIAALSFTQFRKVVVLDNDVNGDDRFWQSFRCH